MGFLLNILGAVGVILIIVGVLALIGVLAINAIACFIAGVIALVIYFAATHGGPWAGRGTYRGY